jgi:hypothetical protein
MISNLDIREAIPVYSDGNFSARSKPGIGLHKYLTVLELLREE